MGFILPSPMTSPAEQARALIAQKESIEKAINAQREIIDANGGLPLNVPLVDADGFPLADIDIWAVRHARVRIIELRNDLKEVMDGIGKALQGVYDPALRRSEETEAAADVEEPFAKVDGVLLGSPASEAVCPWVFMTYFASS